MYQDDVSNRQIIPKRIQIFRHQTNRQLLDYIDHSFDQGINCSQPGAAHKPDNDDKGVL